MFNGSGIAVPGCNARSEEEYSRETRGVRTLDKTALVYGQLGCVVCKASVTNTKLNLKVNICGADFSFCHSRTEGGDAAHR